jgi:hypothetical protein
MDESRNQVLGDQRQLKILAPLPSTLHRYVTTCIEEREAELGEPPSLPQAFFG